MRLKNWRLKCAIQRAFSAVPHGHLLNYVLQRTVGGLPLSAAEIDAHVETGHDHVEALARHGVDPGASTVFEFGAGDDLHMPLIQHGFGVKRHVLVDIRPLAKSKLVLDNVTYLTENPPAHESWQGITAGSTLQDVLDRNGLEYQAPSDAAQTKLDDASVDAVLTSNTLEHIPPADIRNIYAECHRILRPGGVMSMLIDYSDHWSHFDRTITPYNFLQFDEAQWRRYNPSLMYQNRLRHSQHLELLTDAGFEALDVTVWGNDDAGQAALRSVPLVAPFADHDPVDAAITSAHIVLRRIDA